MSGLYWQYVENTSCNEKNCLQSRNSRDNCKAGRRGNFKNINCHELQIKCV